MVEGPLKSHESPSPDWTTKKVDGRTVYYRTQGEAVQVEAHQSYEDVRTVVNLAKEVQDRTPEEQEAIDQGPPPRALDPAEDWLMTFEAETQWRVQAPDEDKGRGV
jgi:hypothetical protein